MRMEGGEMKERGRGGEEERRGGEGERVYRVSLLPIIVTMK